MYNIDIDIVMMVNTLWTARKIYLNMAIRVSHFFTFFELSLVFLTTKALGLYEFTKKISAL